MSLQSEVTEFAGYYFDSSGAPVVLVTDMRAAAKASNAVRSRMSGRRDGERAPIVEKVQWNAAQLTAWRDAMLPSLAISGAVFVDLDERANRVRIGISEQAARGPIMQLAAKVGVPASAIVVSDAAPYRAFSVLTDKIRPIPGGVRLSRWSGPICTYGVGVVWANNALQPQFLSSSHCSASVGQLDQSIYNQANACGV